MRILNAQQIDQLVSMPDLVDVIDQAYIAQARDEYLMPQRMHVSKDENTLLLMPCFADASFSTKLVTVFPNNGALDKPPIYGQVVLNDGTTGQAIALIAGDRLTALRTGAVGACAIRWLKADTHSIGIIGAGVQGYYQAMFAIENFDISELYIFDTSTARALATIKLLGDKYPNTKLIHSPTTDHLLTHSTTIITATTSTEPVFSNKPRLMIDRTFISIGSFRPNMREFPEVLFRLMSNYYVDTEAAKNETGDLVTPLSNGWIEERQIAPFCQLVAKKQEPIEPFVKVFKSVGMALFDLYVAKYIYNRSIAQEIGTEIDF